MTASGGQALVPEQDREIEDGLRLRTKARVDWARGPSLPSMLSGRPTTSPPTPWRSARAGSRQASGVNFTRLMVSSGVAMRRSTSERARPIVFVPRSTPSSRARGGKPVHQGDQVVVAAGHAWLLRRAYSAL